MGFGVWGRVWASARARARTGARAGARVRVRVRGRVRARVGVRARARARVRVRVRVGVRARPTFSAALPASTTLRQSVPSTSLSLPSAAAATALSSTLASRTWSGLGSELEG